MVGRGAQAQLLRGSAGPDHDTAVLRLHADRRPLRLANSSARHLHGNASRIRAVQAVGTDTHVRRNAGLGVGTVGARARVLASRLACRGVPGEIRASALRQILREARNHDGGALLLQKHAALAANSDDPRRHIVLQVEPGCRRA